MAEGAGLLNQYTGNRIEGSNPSLSAKFPKILKMFRLMASLHRDLSRVEPIPFRETARITAYGYLRK